MSKRKIAPHVQATLESEKLNAPINPSGEGELPAVQALLDDDFVNLSDFKASEIALVLQQIVRGQNSLLTLAQNNSDEINRLKAKMESNDKFLEGRFNDQKGEIEEILDRASSLKAVGSKKDKIVAQGAQMFSQAIVEAKAQAAVSKLQFEEMLRRQPKVTVVSPGVWIQIRNGQSLENKLIPEEIRIKHLRWLLPPGIPVDVPKAVADQLADRRKSQIETGLRKDMLSKQMEQSKLANAWANVEGSRAESIPLA